MVDEKLAKPPVLSGTDKLNWDTPEGRGLLRAVQIKAARGTTSAAIKEVAAKAGLRPSQVLGAYYAHRPPTKPAVPKQRGQHKRRRRHGASRVRPAAHAVREKSGVRKGDVHVVPWDDGSYLIRIVDGRKELMVIGYPVELSVLKPKAGGIRG